MLSRRQIFAVLVLMCTALTTNARGFDISLSEDAAQLVYLFSSDSQIGIGGADMGAGVFVNENDDVLLSFNILVVGNSVGRNRALQFGAGLKLYAGELDIQGDDSVSALAIGGKISYVFPASTPMAISLEGFVAPEITSFSDNEDFTELNIRFEIEVAPTARFYVGYRNMETELENTRTDIELDDSGHIGVRFSF